jgi:hypothetical protein
MPDPEPFGDLAYRFAIDLLLAELSQTSDQPDPADNPNPDQVDPTPEETR